MSGYGALPLLTTQPKPALISTSMVTCAAAVARIAKEAAARSIAASLGRGVSGQPTQDCQICSTRGRPDARRVAFDSDGPKTGWRLTGERPSRTIMTADIVDI